MEVITLLQGDASSPLSPLFIIHAISGISLPYLRLEPISDEDRPVYGITSPMHCEGGEDFEYPSTLAELAALYLVGVQKIQPKGPYLLAGWSMGGMLAMFMAQMLEYRGEDVSKVIMLDSANPEVFPHFKSAVEHRAFTKLTFEKTIAFAGLETSGICNASSPIPSPPAEEVDAEDYLTSRPRRSTWQTASSDTSARSSAASLFDYSTPLFSPTDSPLSSPYTSDDSDCDSDCDEDELGAAHLKNLLRLIKLHIHHGLDLIASVRPGDLFIPGRKSNFDTVLIKCTPPQDGETHNHAGAEFIRKVMHEKGMRWDPEQFRSFSTIPFSGDHDGAFHPTFIPELSSIFRRCLEDVD